MTHLETVAAVVVLVELGGGLDVAAERALLLFRRAHALAVLVHCDLALLAAALGLEHTHIC